MSPCSTCTRRKISCDALRPRCSPCRNSHVKCVYSSSHALFEFRDETETIKTRSGRRSKKSKSSIDENSPQQPSPPRLVQQKDIDLQSAELELQGSTSLQCLDTTTMPWMDTMFDSNLGQQWDLISDSVITWNAAANSIIANDFSDQARDLYDGSSGQVFAEFNTPNSHSEGESSGAASTVSDRVLAQHYTQNLTSKYTSKEKGWNNHTYFFNRFNSSHPFVVSSLYAWTSAHLFCNGTLNSDINAMEHYGKSLTRLRDQIGIHLLAENEDEVTSQTWLQFPTRDDDLDAVAVSLYFLAWTDLILSRQGSLRRVLSLVAALLGLRSPDQSHMVYARMAVWFCFLDARASLFCHRNDPIIQSMGDDNGLMRAVEKSYDFLQKEYSLLYPERERQWDEAHKPLYIATCRLVALLGRVSRDAGNTTDECPVLASLCDIQRDLESITEEKATENNVLSIYLTTNALFNTVEIYASRVYRPNESLYVKSTHAKKIITITRHFYQKLKRPRMEAPPTKIWPVPLIMAAIEAKDPIYRDWALQQMQDYCRAGKHFVNACTFVRKVHATEEATGRRSNLCQIADAMGVDFVI